MRRAHRALGLLFAAAAAVVGICAGSASANLSAAKAFTLIRSVPPGEGIERATDFLGSFATERVVNDSAGIRVRRWGGSSDEWFIDVLHDGELVMASRVTWRTRTKRDQQTTFSQLTSAGTKYFGWKATFKSLTEAEWIDMGGALVVRVKMGPELSEGVTLLTGVRDSEVDSGKYGF
jgi:hypothetical protein